MTRKDYVAIAKAIDYLGSQANTTDEFNTLENVVNELCLVFKKDNPKFKVDQFKRACGVHNMLVGIDEN